MVYLVLPCKWRGFNTDTAQPHVNTTWTSEVKNSLTHTALSPPLCAMAVHSFIAAREITRRSVDPHSAIVLSTFSSVHTPDTQLMCVAAPLFGSTLI